MQSRLSERFPSLEGLMSPLESLDRQVWEGHHRTLEDTTHVIGGIGAGFLLYSMVAKWARPLGTGLVFLSALLHLYAFVTSPYGRRAGKSRLRHFSLR